MTFTAPPGGRPGVAAIPPHVPQLLISHDLPLTCLQLYAELQATGRAADPRLLMFARSRAKASDDGSTLVEDEIASASPASPAASPEIDVASCVAFLRRQGLTTEADAVAEKLAAVVPTSASAHPTPLAASDAVTWPSAPRQGVPDHIARISELAEYNTKVEARLSHIVKLLGDRLPTVIESVHSDRKDNVVQLALTAIEFHPAPAVRRSLVYHLLHMHRRPNPEQRTSLQVALRNLCHNLRVASSHAGPAASALLLAPRVEDEIMPEVLALRSHRYPELRSLCASAPLMFDGFVSAPAAVQLVIYVAVPLSADPSSSVRGQVAATLLACARMTSSAASTTSSNDGVGAHSGAVVAPDPHALGASSTLDEFVQMLLRLLLDSKTAVSSAAQALLPPILTQLSNSGHLLPILLPTVIGALARADTCSGPHAVDVSCASIGDQSTTLSLAGSVSAAEILHGVFTQALAIVLPPRHTTPPQAPASTATAAAVNEVTISSSPLPWFASERAVADGLLGPTWEALVGEPAVSDRLRDRLAASLAHASTALSMAGGPVAIGVRRCIDDSFAEHAVTCSTAEQRRRWLAAAIVYTANVSPILALQINGGELNLTHLISSVSEGDAPWNADSDGGGNQCGGGGLDCYSVVCASTAARLLVAGGPPMTAVTNALLHLITSDKIAAVSKVVLKAVEIAASGLRETIAVTAVWPLFAAMIDCSHSNSSDKTTANSALFVDVLDVALGLAGHPGFAPVLDLLFPCVLSIVDSQGADRAPTAALLVSLKRHFLRLPTHHRDRFAIPFVCGVCTTIAAERGPAADIRIKAALTKLVLDAFAALTNCPSLGFHALHDSLLPALRSIAKDCNDTGVAHEAPEVRSMHSALVKTMQALETKAKPRQAMSFFDKVKHELQSIVH